jgi:hypothetical protein
LEAVDNVRFQSFNGKPKATAGNRCQMTYVNADAFGLPLNDVLNIRTRRMGAGSFGRREH